MMLGNLIFDFLDRRLGGNAPHGEDNQSGCKQGNGEGNLAGVVGFVHLELLNHVAHGSYYTGCVLECKRDS